jgi:hypothetical protein
MRSAIERLGKLAPDELLKLSKIGPATLLMRAPEGEHLPGVCSVPLIEMGIDNAERFTMRTVPAPASADRMPRGKVPAPPCERALTK